MIRAIDDDFAQLKQKRLPIYRDRSGMRAWNELRTRSAERVGSNPTISAFPVRAEQRAVVVRLDEIDLVLPRPVDRRVVRKIRRDVVDQHATISAAAQYLMKGSLIVPSLPFTVGPHPQPFEPRACHHSIITQNPVAPSAPRRHRKCDRS